MMGDTTSEKIQQRASMNGMDSKIDKEAEYNRAIQLGLETSCVHHIDALMYCISPANQFSTYYQDGTFDDCAQMGRNMFQCLKVKTNVMTAKEKEQAIKEIYVRNEASPSAKIWEFREDPEKDWNIK